MYNNWFSDMYIILNKYKVKSTCKVLYELKKDDTYLANIKSCEDIKTTNNKYRKKVEFRDLEKNYQYKYEALKKMKFIQ